MEYSVQALSELSGVSKRTLRFYDSIGLLKPNRIAENGYRVYTSFEADRLQQILLYRSFGIPLKEIGRILDAPDFDEKAALESHLDALRAQKGHLEAMIHNIEKTLRAKKGGFSMNDKEKFDGFREQMLAENDARYGTEIRGKYGDDAVDASIFKVRGMTEEVWMAAEHLRTDAEALFREAMKTGDPASETAQRACGLHAEWIRKFWKEGTYSKTAHKGLGEMYAADPRFRAYYDLHVAPDAADFIRHALAVYAG